jgi:hypothetical protein
MGLFANIGYFALLLPENTVRSWRHPKGMRHLPQTHPGE